MATGNQKQRNIKITDEKRKRIEREALDLGGGGAVEEKMTAFTLGSDKGVPKKEVSWP